MGLSACFSLIKPIIFAKVLSVEEFGFYALFILTSFLMSYIVSSGVDSAFLRKASILKGEKKEEQLVEFKNSVFSSAIKVGLAFSLLTVFVVTLLLNYWNLESELVLIGCLSSLIFIFNLFMTYLRVENKLEIFSLSLACRVLVSLCLAWLGYLEFSILGLILGEIFSYIIIIVYLFVKIECKLRHTEFTFYFSLMKAGFGFSMSSLTQYLTINIDKWFVAFFLGNFIIGIYSFYFIVFSIFLSLSNIVNQMLTPRWLVEFGNNKSLKLLMIKLKKYFLYSIALASLLGFVLYFVLHFLINNYYHDYLAGIGMLPVIIFASIIHVANLFEVTHLATGFGGKLLSIRLNVLVIIALLSVVVGLLNLDIMYFALLFLVGRILTLIQVFLSANKLITLYNVTSNSAA